MREEFAEILKKDEEWLSAMASRFGVSGSKDIVDYLDLFTTDMYIRGREVGHKDEHDFKSHFCDWLRKELKSQSRRETKVRQVSADPATVHSLPLCNLPMIKGRWAKIVGHKMYMTYFHHAEIQLQNDGTLVFISPHPEVTEKVLEWKSKLEEAAERTMIIHENEEITH